MFSYKKVEELANKNNISFYKLAKETEMDPVVFYDWKSGKSCPKADKVIRIAKYFNLPFEYFLENANQD